MPTIPPWLANLIAELPAIAALILQIFSASNGNPTPEQKAQLAAYSAVVDGINAALAYHVNA